MQISALRHQYLKSFRFFLRAVKILEQMLEQLMKLLLHDNFSRVFPCYLHIRVIWLMSGCLSQKKKITDVRILGLERYRAQQLWHQMRHWHPVTECLGLVLALAPNSLSVQMSTAGSRSDGSAAQCLTTHIYCVPHSRPGQASASASIWEANHQMGTLSLCLSYSYSKF